MPDAINYFRIIPVALLAAPNGTDPNPLGAWEQATAVPSDTNGLSADGPLYTLADAKPRAITHRVSNGRAKQEQVAILDAAGYDANRYLNATALDPAFAGVICKKQNLTQGDPTANLLAEVAAAGLTIDPDA